MGEDRRGAFRVNRLETLDSKVTSEAGKAARGIRMGDFHDMIECLTDLPRQDEEVIVGQGPMLVRVEQRVHVQAISGLILPEDVQSRGVIQDLSHGA
jgi:hypothetical protein